MRNLRPLDKALLACFLFVWSVCLVLSMRSALRPTAIPAIFVSAPVNPEGYPMVAGFRPDVRVIEPGVRVGDRLVRLGGTDLRGVGPVGFFVRVAQEQARTRGIPVIFERGGERGESTLPVGSYGYFVWPVLPVSLVLAVTGVLLLLRAPESAMARALSQAFASWAIAFVAVFGGSSLVTHASMVINMLSSALTPPLSIRALLLFPDEKPPTKRWARVGPWLGMVNAPVVGSALYGFPLPPGAGLLSFAMFCVALNIASLLVVRNSYRGADPVGRRRLKWFVFGMYAASIPMLAGFALAAADPRFTAAAFLSVSALALVPISVLIAVARYNLFDIDRVISATASYNVLLILLIAGGLVLVPQAAQAASTFLGLDPTAGQVLVSALLATIVVPCHRRLRPQIERILFAERHTVDQGMARLLAELSESTPGELPTRLAEGLDAVMRPTRCVCYGRADSGYRPLFAQGGAAQPSIEVANPLVSTLRQRHRPLAKPGVGLHGTGVGPFERAALEVLDAEVVIPLDLRGDLWGFVCLGPKRSGDVYTVTDLALLAAAADKFSTQLLRCDEAEVTRGITEALRRYVAAPVAERLESGQALTPAEREVSVLFCDLRGYTTYSETRSAEAVFSLVNRYTDAVSRVVAAHGGTVAEFTGDGVMAVFGALTPLARKERSAIQAARGILEVVRSLEVDCRIPGLSVGVGIATGKAFVGSIQSGERLIWTVVGNAPNLAARLQALTRELAAAIAVDAETWVAAEQEGQGFERHPNTPIRGRQQTADVYTLPLVAG